MTPDELRARTMRFGLSVIDMVESLPRRRAVDVIGGQLIRAGTSVGSNYRAACRAKSNADFISKMGTVEEELDESLYWLEVLRESKILTAEGVKALMEEAEELLAITVSSINTARGKKRGDS